MPLTTVQQGMLANNAVISTSISANNIQTINIASSAVVARNISSYEIQTYHLSSNCVDSRIIASSAVTTRHYAASSIQNVHLSAACVTTSNIALCAVTLDRLNADVLLATNGSRIFHNTRSTLTLTNTNYITAHGAIIINRYTAGTGTILFDESLPSNFHCWVLNTSLTNLNLTSNLSRLMRFDKRKLSEISPYASSYSCVLTGSYSGSNQAFPFVYIFIGQDNSVGNPEVVYVMPISVTTASTNTY